MAVARENEIVLVLSSQCDVYQSSAPVGKPRSNQGQATSIPAGRSRSKCTTFCWRKVRKMEVGRLVVATPERKPVPSSSGVESELAIAEDGVKEEGRCI